MVLQLSEHSCYIVFILYSLGQVFRMQGASYARNRRLKERKKAMLLYSQKFKQMDPTWVPSASSVIG